MEAILNVALPFFGLIFAGYAARHLRVLERASVHGLNAFVFYFALPALLFTKVAEAPLAALLDARLLAAYYGASLALALTTAGLGRLLFGGGLGVQALRALCATFGNIGYMGVALIVTAFGAERALPAILILTVDNVVLIPLTIALLEADRGAARGRAMLRNLAGGLLRNPLMLAIAAGLALATSGLAVPAPLAAFTGLLGQAAAPCALFALGATLAVVPLASASTEAALLAGLKIVAHPLLVALAVTRLLPLPAEVAGLTVLLAALPTGANVFVLAQRYDLHVGPTSAAVFASHLGSVATVSALLAMLGG